MARILKVPVQSFVANPTLTSVTPELAPQGTYQAQAKSAYANGDTITFHDGVAADVVIEYRVTAGSVTAGHIKADISAATNAQSVAAILEPLLLANLPHVGSATDNGTGLITLTDTAADQANPYTISASNVGDVVTGMVAPSGSKTWSYKIVGVDANGGTTAASAQVSTAAGGSALGALNLNRLAWTDPANAVTIKIYRTVHGASSTPTTTGLIGSVAAGVQTFDDTGQAGDSSTAPSSNTSGIGAVVECESLREKSVQIDGTFSSTNQIQGSIDGTNWQNEGSAAGSAAVVNITTSWAFIRNKQTAFSSGNPTITLCGHEER